MKKDRLTSPGKRSRPITIRPSATASPHPLADYIVPPSDSRGRSTSVSVAVPPAFIRLSDIVMRTDTLPFKSTQDVFRWCIHHGLEKLIAMTDNKDLKTEWNLLESWLEVVAVEHEQLAFAATLRRIEEGIDKLLREGHPDRALQLAETVWMQSDRIDTPYWRKMYRRSSKKMLDLIKGGAKKMVGTLVGLPSTGNGNGHVRVVGSGVSKQDDDGQEDSQAETEAEPA